MVLPVTLLLVAGGITYLVVMFAQRYFKRAASHTVTVERDGLRAEISGFDDAIGGALAEIAQYSPLDLLNDVEAVRKRVETEIDGERSKVRDQEAKLEEMQLKVDQQETRHAELKRGKENCDQVADNIKANREKLMADQVRLETELKHSAAQLNILRSEVELNPAQEAALSELQRAVEKGLGQLQHLFAQHEGIAKRFIALETQYVELEKEFRRLVDAELRGMQ